MNVLEAQQTPRVHVAPRRKETHGDLAGDFSAAYGLTPDPWQQLVLDDWLGRNGSRWSSLTCGLSVPRQNGKNGLIEIRELFGMVGRGERILHTAHEIKTARKAFKRLMYFFGSMKNDPGAKFPELNALVEEIRQANGQEAVVLKNGGSVEVVARTKSSGRGFTVDVLVMDEAQELSDEDLEALMPTTASAPLGDPQWIFTGTPPGPKSAGEVFTRVRSEALEGKSKRLAWHEWSADGAVDLDDRAAWYSTNPALGRRLQIEVLEGERARFSDDGFARERLGMWATSTSTRVIGAEAWGLAEDPSSVAGDRLALGIDVTPEMTAASVAIAGQRADGNWHVELVDSRAGVDWLPQFVSKFLEVNSNVRAVVLDVGTSARVVADDMAKLKVKLTSPRVADIGVGCEKFAQGIYQRQVFHLGQTQLDVALASARKRKLGSTDLWAWNRKDVSTDITPLVAATLALWGAQNSEVTRPKVRPGSGRVVVFS